MNLNENLKTRRKQLAILAAVIIGARLQRAVSYGTASISRLRNNPHQLQPQI